MRCRNPHLRQDFSRVKRRGTRVSIAGAQVVVEAMLQTPHFLFHLEGGLDGRTEAYRVASRYRISSGTRWRTEALFAAAKNGELLTDARIGKQAKRLLADERARLIRRVPVAMAAFRPAAQRGARTSSFPGIQR